MGRKAMFSNNAQRLGIHLEPDIREQLDELVRLTGKNKSKTIAEAIKLYHVSVKHRLSGGEIIFVSKDSALKELVRN
jgi:metal-responsive CopG/Arc/MetJ family transcriptional regulator